MAFTIKQNDLRPYLPVKFYEPDAITPMDLSGATSVSMVVRSKSALVTDPPKIKRAMTAVNALIGEFEFRWVSGDTDTVGEFNYEFEIMWPLTKPQTIPADSYLTLIVVDDLG